MKALHIILLSLASALSAADKVALVIGNNTYPDNGELVTPLGNCVRDATLIAKTLRGLGFQVTELTEASRSQMEEGLVTFQESIVKGGSALIYFAGHGIEVDGQSYVLGTNAKLKARSMLAEEGLRAETLAQFMVDAGASASFLLLDCCREAPPTEWLSRGIRKRGLADTRVDGDVIIAFAAKPGQSAQDAPLVSGGGVSDLNSPYAQALAKWLPQGLKHTDLFLKVRQEVNMLTAGKQRTWENGSFLVEYVFGSGTGNQSSPPVQTPPPAPSSLVPTVPTVPTPGGGMARTDLLPGQGVVPMPQSPPGGGGGMTRDGGRLDAELVNALADLGAIDALIAKEQAEWNAANDTINRLTDFRRTPVREGSAAHRLCVNADEVLIRVKNSAPERIIERARLEAKVRALGGDPQVVRPTTQPASGGGTEAPKP